MAHRCKDSEVQFAGRGWLRKCHRRSYVYVTTECACRGDATPTSRFPRLSTAKVLWRQNVVCSERVNESTSNRSLDMSDLVNTLLLNIMGSGATPSPMSISRTSDSTSGKRAAPGHVTPESASPAKLFKVTPTPTSASDGHSPKVSSRSPLLSSAWPRRSRVDERVTGVSQLERGIRVDLPQLWRGWSLGTRVPKCLGQDGRSQDQSMLVLRIGADGQRTTVKDRSWAAHEQVGS